MGKKKNKYCISGNFRDDLIFAIFANDLKTRKYVSAKNCTLKESLEVGSGKIIWNCCILSVIAPCFTDLIPGVIFTFFTFYLFLEIFLGLR